MNKFFKEQHKNELDYIFNTFFNDLKIVSEEKKIEGRPVLASEVLLNNESYILYKYEGGQLIFVPKNIVLENNFLPIYFLGASDYGIGFSILTREEDLLEKKSYSFIFREESKEVESHFSYMHYVDLNNDLANLFNKENVSLELFLIRKTFNQLLTSTKLRTSINVIRNENETLWDGTYTKLDSRSNFFAAKKSKDGQEIVYLVNYSGSSISYNVGSSGTDLMTGNSTSSTVSVPALSAMFIKTR